MVKVRREGWWLEIAVLGKVCFHVSGRKFALAERKHRGGTFDLSICFHRIEILNQTLSQPSHSDSNLIGVKYTHTSGERPVSVDIYRHPFYNAFL
jgi:hypothetical protein